MKGQVKTRSLRWRRVYESRSISFKDYKLLGKADVDADVHGYVLWNQSPFCICTYIISRPRIEQSFSIRGSFVPRGHLARLEETWMGAPGEDAIGIQEVETRDAFKHQAMQKQSLHQRITQPNMWMVPAFGNPGSKPWTFQDCAVLLSVSHSCAMPSEKRSPLRSTAAALACLSHVQSSRFCRAFI